MKENKEKEIGKKEAKEEREGMSKKEGFILSMVILLLVITILVKIVFNGLESLKEKEMNATNDMELTTEKCLTGCENFAYQLRSNNPMNGIDVFVSVENQVNVVINQEKIKEEYNINLKEELMDGALLFNQKVQDIFVSTIGQDQTATYIFFLMEDGTVEYINVYDCLTKNGFMGTKKLEKVEHITKFYAVDRTNKDSEYGGIYSVLAWRQDGKFYDLETVVNK